MVANLAAESARTLPRMSQWPGIHWMWDRATVPDDKEAEVVVESGEEPGRDMQERLVVCKDSDRRGLVRCWLIQSSVNCIDLFSY